MKKMIRPGIYRRTLKDSMGKKYEPKKPFETYRMVTVQGEKKREWGCFTSFDEAKEFHNSTANISLRTVRFVWEHMLKHGMAGRTRTTVEKIMSQVRPLEPLMNTAIASHTPVTVTEWLTEISSSENLSTMNSTRASFSNELRLMAQIYSYYKRTFDWNFVSPITPDHKRKSVLREPEKITKDLSLRELSKVLSLMEEPFRTLLEVQYSLYARIQEAAALHYEDFDPKTGMVDIHRSVMWPKKEGDKAIVRDRLKASERKLIRSNHAAKLLQEYAMKSGIRSGLVFRESGGPIPYWHIRYAYNRAFEKAGMAHRGTHIIRHASLTEHYATSRDIYETMRAAGHTRVETAQKYAKHREDSLDATQNIMDEKLRVMRTEVG